MRNLQIFSTQKNKSIFIILLFSLLILTILSISLGSARIPLRELIGSVFGRPLLQSHKSIILYARIPRTLACVLSGIALSVSGVIIQTVLSNPLASPNIIGVNSGAGVGVVIACLLFPRNVLFCTLFSFLGALIAVFIIVFIAKKVNASKISLVLTGLAISTMFSAIIDLAISYDSSVLASYTDFKIGGFSGVSLNKMYPSFLVITISLIIAFVLSTELDILSLGKEQAIGLGLKYSKYQILFLILAACLASAAVSFSGIIGFIGLIVPHIMRSLIGYEKKPLIIFSALFGASFMLIADIISRLIFSPFEMPVGILLSFIGGPFFIFLLFKQRRR